MVIEKNMGEAMRVEERGGAKKLRGVEQIGELRRKIEGEIERKEKGGAKRLEKQKR